MPYKVLLGLILCNLVWSLNPAMAKLVLVDSPPQLAAWLRFTSAFSVYLVFALRGGRRGVAPYFSAPRSFKDVFLILLISLLGFALSPLLQMKGLDSSRATENALIVAMEPMVTVLLARVFLGEVMSWRQLSAFGVAFFGFCLLSGITWGGVSREAHLFGNFLILVSLIGEGMYSVAGRKLLERHPALGIFGSALLMGVICLTLILWGVWGPEIFRGVFHLHARAWLAVFWLGPLGTAATYLYWMQVLNEAPVASLALTVFIQPVFGALWGYEFLEEHLSETQMIGAVCIVGAVLFASLFAIGRVKKRSRKSA